MSNAFNPFATNAPTATPNAPAPTQPQRPIATSMNDPGQYDGFTTQFFKHVPGEFDLRVTDYQGLRTDKLGRACHIFVTVLTSTNAEIPVGSEWRFAYRYDYERGEKSDLDTYGSDQRTLGAFIQAICNQKVSAGFDARGAEISLRAPEGQAWLKSAPRHVHLSAAMGKPKPNKQGQVAQYRNDFWSAARAV